MQRKTEINHTFGYEEYFVGVSRIFELLQRGKAMAAEQHTNNSKFQNSSRVLGAKRKELSTEDSLLHISSG